MCELTFWFSSVLLFSLFVNFNVWLLRVKENLGWDETFTKWIIKYGATNPVND